MLSGFGFDAFQILNLLLFTLFVIIFVLKGFILFDYGETSQ